MIDSNEKTFELYLEAVQCVRAAGYENEVEWFRNRGSGPDFSEPELLREAAWVILCAGFKEKVVAGIFDWISLCFCDWESAAAIVARSENCIASSLEIFRSRRKIHSIMGVAEIVLASDFHELQQMIKHDPVTMLARLPGIGAITASHLARNLGFACAKNDRHLVRLGQAWGFKDGVDLCAAVSRASEEPVGVVDVVLWRYCVLSATTSRASEAS